MEEFKNLFDVIFLSDKELNINSDYENDRPCIIVGIDSTTGEGYVVPLSTRYNPNDPNRMQYQLVFGSYVDFSQEPIRITEAQLRGSQKSDKGVSAEDADELEERYYKGVNY